MQLKKWKKPKKIPENDNMLRLQLPCDSKSPDQDEQMAICYEERSTLCNEP